MTTGRFTTALAAMAAILSSVANGAQLVATRFLVQHTDALAVAVLRYVIAFACLAPLLRRAYLPSQRDCMIILSLGVVVAGICPWLLTISMKYTTDSRGALVICTSPLFTLIRAAALGYKNAPYSVLLAQRAHSWASSLECPTSCWWAIRGP